MARRSRPGPYRMAWDREPAFRTFMAAVTELDAETEPRRPRTRVLESLRDCLLPVFRRLDPSPGGFHDAVHAWLTGESGCGPLSLLEADAADCRSGAACRLAPERAAERGRELEICMARHREGCSADFLFSVVEECRRLGCEAQCLGLRALEDLAGVGSADRPCAAYLPLDTAIRECWLVNGSSCRSIPFLTESSLQHGTLAGREPSALPLESAPAVEVPDRGDNHEDGVSDNEAEPAAVALVEAIWNWAVPFRLVAPIEELHRLGSSQLEDFFAPEMAYHRDFLFCAYWTLQAMAESPGGDDPLRWVVHGEPHAGPADPLVDDMRGVPAFVEKSSADQSEIFRVRHEDRDRYEIDFRPEKWIPGGSESGPEAATRIVTEFKERLERMLEAQARQQQEVGNLVPAKTPLAPDRARVLALYQVYGETLVGAAHGHAGVSANDANQISDKVGAWVREAAEQLLGPYYEIWLRRPQKGYPKGRKRGSERREQ